MPGDPVVGAPTMARTLSPPVPTTTGASVGVGMASQIAAKLAMKRGQPKYNYRAVVAAFPLNNLPPDVSPHTSGNQMPADLR